MTLDVALRAFGGTYDRYPLYRDSQLVDAITALEALVGISTELRFRIAFRVLLRSFVVFSVNVSHSYSKSFFDEKLDITLADTGEREKLRSALGLA